MYLQKGIDKRCFCWYIYDIAYIKGEGKVVYRAVYYFFCRFWVCGIKTADVRCDYA